LRCKKIIRPRNYDINKKDLKEKYKEYQKVLHPDVLQGCGIDNQEFSKLLVEAYMTLSHDTSRAAYMVSDMQLGIDDKQAEDLKVSDFDFLEEQFERRMEIQMTEDQNKLQEILNRVMRDKHTFKQEIAHQLKARNNQSALEAVAKLKFIDKLEEDVRHKLNVN
jgi:molecular chaperone HscB